MIAFERVTKIYAQRQVALSDVSFELPAGSTIGLLGANGSGKSTLLRIALGLISPTAGEVRVLGQPMTPGAKALRQRIGFLSDAPAFPKDLTALGYLGLVGRCFGLGHREHHARMGTLLRAVGLTDDAGRKVATYSTGMRTRLGIAASLMNDPELLVWDEPTAGLDPISRRQTLELLEQFRHRKTVVLSSHILGDVDRVCDRLLILNQGQLLFDGSRSDLENLLPRNVLEVRVTGNPDGFGHAAVDDDRLGQGPGLRRLPGRPYRLSADGPAEPVDGHTRHDRTVAQLESALRFRRVARSVLPGNRAHPGQGSWRGGQSRPGTGCAGLADRDHGGIRPDEPGLVRRPRPTQLNFMPAIPFPHPVTMPAPAGHAESRWMRSRRVIEGLPRRLLWPRFFVRRCLALMSLGLLGGSELWAGIDAPGGLSARPAALADPDLLWLHEGDPVTGRFENQTLELQTPYGRIQLPIDRVSEVRLATGPHQIDTVITVNGNRFSGFLADPVFTLRPQLGPALALHRDLVTRLVLGGREETPSLIASGLIFLLRNGDTLSGHLAGDHVRLTTPYLEMRIAADEIESVSFAHHQPLLASLRSADGRSVDGLWPDQDLEVVLELGLTLRVHPARLAAIQRPARWGSPAAPPDLTPTLGPTDPGQARPGMVWIAPGEFVMGSPVDEQGRDLDEGPQTRVRISRGFWMGIHEVTQAEYQAVMGDNPSRFLGDARRPVERVRHRDAVEYCVRLTRLHDAAGALPCGHAYRLPTEAEWEYACRAGTTTRFSHGDDLQGHALEDYAWFSANSNSSTHPVGTRRPNPWGLHDLHGNVLEWCLDGAGAGLPGGEVVDYQAPAEGLLRIARGGSWLYGAKACRSANRDSYGESTRSSDLGFRVVLAPMDP
jgi:ABC-2 type transport system ATP-binding protein